MFSIWKAVASRGRDEMTMWRSSLSTPCTQSMVVWALIAGSTVKTWSHLFLTKRTSFARRPASAAATGDDSRPTVETVSKSTAYGMAQSPYGMSVYVARVYLGREARLAQLLGSVPRCRRAIVIAWRHPLHHDLLIETAGTRNKCLVILT